jgi:hypothetical protein
LINACSLSHWGRIGREEKNHSERMGRRCPGGQREDISGNKNSLCSKGPWLVLGDDSMVWFHEKT